MSNSAWAPEDKKTADMKARADRDRLAFLSFWQARYYTLRSASIDYELDIPGVRLACWQSWLAALRWADGHGSCYITPKLRYE